ncbi:RNA-binding protein, putative [Plasmodium relictum]|uniref:RNA-binding protein, putative n=1 Tax=Plasmodium relictum TaxID=85471 RepID=A0A1J1HBP3_PLARL|nr:RNA-binding protein, putative [Plasmodium relictum]CRH00843.1 RNA-binding protein, putative [Plasmodium relictum]
MNNSNKVPLPNENKVINNSYNTKTLWVGDLDKIKDETVDENYILYCMFYEFREDIMKIKLCKEKNSQKNSYAFIEFSNSEIAKYCFDNLNGKWIPGKIHKFKLNWAKYNMTDNINQNGKNLSIELDDKGTYSIYVGSLPPNTTKEEIENLFRNFYKSICFVKMIKNCNKNQNKIYCFIHFLNYQECIRALTEMDGYIFKGYKIKVNTSNGIKTNNPENNNSCTNKKYDLVNNLNSMNVSDFSINENNIINSITDEQKKNNKNYYFYYNNINNELNNIYKNNYYDYDHLNSNVNTFPGYNSNNNIIYDSNSYTNHINQINNYNTNINHICNYNSDINHINNYNINCVNEAENHMNYNMNNLNYINNFNYTYSEKNRKINLYDKKEINRMNDINAYFEHNNNSIKENETIEKKINSSYENSYESNLYSNSFSNKDNNNFRVLTSKNNINNDNGEDSNDISNYDNNINNKNKHNNYDNNESISNNNSNIITTNNNTNNSTSTNTNTNNTNTNNTNNNNTSTTTTNNNDSIDNNNNNNNDRSNYN